MSKKAESAEKGKEKEKEPVKGQPEAEEAKVEEEEAEEKPAAKPVKKRTEKKRRIDKKIHTYYKLGDQGLARLRPFCERCGQGFFMADHGDRFTCGHCGFSRYKQTQS
jgi:small subunit ribosomal protein S27Ae